MIGKRYDGEENKQQAFAGMKRTIPKARRTSQGGLPKKELQTQNSEVVAEKRKNLFEFKAPPDSTKKPKKKENALFEPITLKDDK